MLMVQRQRLCCFDCDVDDDRCDEDAGADGAATTTVLFVM